MLNNHSSETQSELQCLYQINAEWQLHETWIAFFGPEKTYLILLAKKGSQIRIHVKGKLKQFTYLVFCIWVLLLLIWFGSHYPKMPNFHVLNWDHLHFLLTHLILSSKLLQFILEE